MRRVLLSISILILADSSLHAVLEHNGQAMHEANMHPQLLGQLSADNCRGDTSLKMAKL